MPGRSEKPGGREAALSTTIATFGGIGMGELYERPEIAFKSNMGIWNRVFVDTNL